MSYLRRLAKIMADLERCKAAPVDTDALRLDALCREAETTKALDLMLAAQFDMECG